MGGRCSVCGKKSTHRSWGCQGGKLKQRLLKFPLKPFFSYTEKEPPVLTSHEATRLETTLPGVLCCQVRLCDWRLDRGLWEVTYGTSGFSLLPVGCSAGLDVVSSSEQVRRTSENTKISPRIWQHNKRSSVGPEWLWEQQAAHPDHLPTSRPFHGEESSVLFEPEYFRASVTTI